MSELTMMRGRVHDVLCNMCDAVHIAVDDACSALNDSLLAARESIGSGLGSIGANTEDLVDPVVGCSAFISEYSDGGDEDMSELRMLEGRVHDVLHRMCDAANVMLPRGLARDCSEGGAAVSEHFRLSKDPSDPCKIVLSVDPEWRSVPPTVSDKARDILCNFPPHLEGLPLDGMSEYDIVLNEILARPADSSSYVSHLRELQCVRDADLDVMCTMLGLQLSWNELKRQLVAKGLRRVGSFSIFDLVEEMGSECRAQDDNVGEPD